MPFKKDWYENHLPEKKEEKPVTKKKEQVTQKLIEANEKNKDRDA